MPIRKVIYFVMLRCARLATGDCVRPGVVLFLPGIGDDVAEKLTDCFSAETDEELAEKINGAFYTAFSVDEISAILESVREEYESERSEKA